MGEVVSFPSNGHSCQGYLARPEHPNGAGIVVIQEWWGLVPHIEELTERFAAQGYVALAPDLYHGEKSTEPDEARKLVMALDTEKAAQDLDGAVNFVKSTTGKDIGIVGFCMGGGLALVESTRRPEAVAACVVFYGTNPFEGFQPQFERMTAPVMGHFGELDGSVTPDRLEMLKKELDTNEIDNEIFVYPGAQHAFFNDTRPEVYSAEASELAWNRTLGFLQSHLIG